MINIELHRTLLIKILREIYTDTVLRTALGFKGGTCALFFYGLPRFSVDLDFDLLDEAKVQVVLERLKAILPQFGKLVDAREKRHTLFFLIIYQRGERNIKIEISKRPLKSEFALRNFLGIAMLVMQKKDMAAGKLAAFLTRKRRAARDIFDLWFFLKNDWQINAELVKKLTGLTLTEALDKAKERLKQVKKTEMLAGVGELLDEKHKALMKNRLLEELMFLIELYRQKC